jgi:hypothetical protein
MSEQVARREFSRRTRESAQMNATATIVPTGPRIVPSGARIAPSSPPIAPPSPPITPSRPQITPSGPQYMRALERANKVRLARADLKRGVAVGEIDVAEVILDCPWEAESMAVADLLMSQRRWGQTRSRKFLAQIPMSEKKTVGSMTDRQRRTLAAMLTSAQRGRAWSAPSRLTDNLRTA